MNLLEESQNKSIDYGEVKSTCKFNLVDKRTVDVSIIIPVYNRTYFNHIVSKHFISAISHYNNKKSGHRKISITFVEHSEKPEHEKLCLGNINYIWIPKNGKKFNKCLCHNIGALYSNQSKYYLFHDVDIIVPITFFEKLFLNLRHFDALQAFTKRRVLYCSKSFTDKVLQNGGCCENEVTKAIETQDIEPGYPGAPGGSIFISKSHFLEIGGYDAEFFTEYSIEDQVFFDKINVCGKMGFCDNPELELMHLWHEASFGSTTKREDFRVFESFRALSQDDKEKFIQISKQKLKK